MLKPSLKSSFLFVIIGNLSSPLLAQVQLQLPEKKRFVDKIEVVGGFSLNFPDDHGWYELMYEESDGQTIDELHAENGYFIGASFMNKLSTRFEIGARLSSDRRRISRTVSALDNNGNVYSESHSQQKNDYLTFSLIPAYFFSNSNRLHVFAGLTYAYIDRSIISAKYFTNGQYMGGATVNTTDGEKNVVEALAGVGYSLPVTEQFICVFRLHGNYGLSYTSNQNKQKTSINIICLSLAIQYSRS